MQLAGGSSESRLSPSVEVGDLGDDGGGGGGCGGAAINGLDVDVDDGGFVIKVQFEQLIAQVSSDYC